LAKGGNVEEAINEGFNEGINGGGGVFDQDEVESETSSAAMERLRRQAKSQRFWDYLTMVSSLIYAIGLVMLGLSFYFADIFIVTENNWDMSAVKQGNSEIFFKVINKPMKPLSHKIK